MVLPYLTFNVIPNPVKRDIRINLNLEFSGICPFNGSRDRYIMDVEYVPGEMLIEVLSFKKCFDIFYDEEFIMERIVEMVMDEVVDKVSPERVNIMLREESPGIGVGVFCDYHR